MSAALPLLLVRRLPFFYGWVILFCTCCAGFSRQGGAVSTLSIFAAPMTSHFGWSRTALAGAVSLGGLIGALLAAPLGRLLDNWGARAVLCIAVITTGGANMLLSLTGSLAMFYVLFCVARTNFSSPFDLGIYGAVNNWFVARRAFAVSIATLAQMLGLVILPLIAQAAILRGGWRAGWLAVGISVLLVGFIPNFLFMVRRPEDMGLLPDRRSAGQAAQTAPAEVSFTRAEALRTRAYWLLCLFALFAYPVQAGVGLHQAPYLIERGISPAATATIVGTFSFMSGVASFCCGLVPRRIPIRTMLMFTGLALCAGALAMLRIATATDGYIAAGIFGIGVGGLMTLLPIAWADYYGRGSYGAIRGIALSVQVLAQAVGPLLSGILRDWSGSYAWSLWTFVALSALSAVAALMARPPQAAASRRRYLRDPA
jgi:sugar phosphate permease